MRNIACRDKFNYYKNFGSQPYYGFDNKPPKLTANFVTNEYKQNGSVSSFAELFSFTRAGKAWLVKESGLVEYAIDVPRFDEGLLIEQSATNLLNQKDSLSTEYSSNDATAYPVSKRFGGGVYGIKSLANPPILTTYSRAFCDTAPGVKYVGSGYLQSENTESYVKLRSIESGGALPEKLLPSDNYVRLQFASTASTTSTRFPSPWSQQRALGWIENKYNQFETGIVASSYILPEVGNITTRPADFLTSKITGTTVTGDWDSTLTLSIVNGQLVHSGYGKIRTLEIN